MDLYAENILEHYRTPRHKAPLARADVTHTEENLSCGDRLTLTLAIKNGVIDAIGWDGDGCAISQAAMSMLGEELIGQKIDDAAHIPVEHIRNMLGVPVGPRRTKCALLCLHTLKNTLLTYAQKPTQSWTQTVAVAED